MVTAKLDEEGQPLFTIADMHYNDSYDLQFSLRSYQSPGGGAHLFKPSPSSEIFASPTSIEKTPFTRDTSQFVVKYDPTPYQWDG